uniref:Uncharacterized protein n=1 Tax=Enterococcus faecium TaxID=1352 RepID=A0A2S0T1Q3_ENTFC|nr:hypothetical protein [Enterococcus faecium]
MCGENRMHGVDRGKNWRLLQKFTYRYSPGRLSIKQMPFQKIKHLKDYGSIA